MCGWVGCGGVERRGHPFRGGWSHSPPVGKGGDEDDDVAVLPVVLDVRGTFSVRWGSVSDV